MALACRREEDSQCEPIVQAKKYSAPTAASDGTVQVAGEVEELALETQKRAEAHRTELFGALNAQLAEVG